MTNKTLTHSTPEAQGIASPAILAFVEATEKDIDSLHSFMLLRHGAVVAQGWWSPYAPEYPHVLFSLSKSFTSTAVGLAVTDGLLSVDDPVLSFFPEDAPKKVSRNLAAMRVRHLLAMCTGHAEDTTEYLHRRRDGNWVKAFLARPVKYKPGTHFLYNTGASYILSAIVQKLTGITILDYLGERIFVPLGIEGATWGTCPRGINLGGFGLNIKTEDIAKFGQLYLQKGQWNDEQLLPEAWVEEATRSHIDNAPNEATDWAQGYGYQFWRCQPQNVYRGDGAHGQYCIVMPDQDAVVAITSGVSDMQAVLNLVWKHLLPAMQPDPLPADGKMQIALEQKLASLALPLVAGETTSPTAARVTGKRFVFEKNVPRLKSVTCEFDTGEATITLRNAQGVQRIVCGQGTWIKGTVQLGWEVAGQIAASGAWTDENTYTAKVYFYEAPFCVTLTCHFDEGQLTFNFKQNVSFGPTEWPQLTGQAR
ncbi:MAG: beta-lactamase family protein [Anaerolineae bacterium]|nr:beta-lactamase family protein [Anaerolineae bacterium]